MQILSREWALGEWIALSRFPKGRNNESFRLQTTSGEFVLRRSRATKTLEAMQFEIALTLHLRAGSVPAPEAVAAVSGEAWARCGDRLWSVFRYIEGRPFSGSSADRVQVGATLGRCHRLLRSFTHPAPPPPPSEHHHAAGVRLIENLTRPDLSESWAIRLDRAREIDRALERLPPPRELDMLIHGACRKSSFLYRDERVAGFLDFDSARLGNRALDVTVACVSFARAHGAGCPLDPERVVQLRRGYESELRFGPAVAEAIPGLLANLLFYRVALSLSRSIGRLDDADASAKTDDRLAAAKWIIEHPDELSRLFC